MCVCNMQVVSSNVVILFQLPTWLPPFLPPEPENPPPSLDLPLRHRRMFATLAKIFRIRYSFRDWRAMRSAVEELCPSMIPYPSWKDSIPPVKSCQNNAPPAAPPLLAEAYTL